MENQIPDLLRLIPIGGAILVWIIIKVFQDAKSGKTLEDRKQEWDKKHQKQADGTIRVERRKFGIVYYTYETADKE